MNLSMIVAISTSGVIGINDKLPWHLPSELAHFKRTTSGYPMIMGRATFESLPGILPGRPHIVITRNRKYKPHLTSDAVHIVHSVEEALNTVNWLQRDAKHNAKAFVIGGAEIYKLFFPYIGEAFITRVMCTVPIDENVICFDPRLDLSDDWKSLSMEPSVPSGDEYQYIISHYVRR